MMKKIIYIALVISALSSVSAGAQSYGQFLSKLLEQSPQMELYTARRSSDSLMARRGLNPANPEISYSHILNGNLFGEAEFEQRFDFPTVYHQRNKLAGYKIDRVEMEFMSSRRELLLSASDAYNAVVYAKKMVDLQIERVAHLRRIDSLAEAMLQAGGATIVERSVAGFMYSTAVVERRSAEAALESALEQVKSLGVKQIELTSMAFPKYSFTGSKEEFVEAAVRGDWAMAAQRVDSLIARRELKLARSEWAPGLKLGYKYSRAEGVQGHELITGISLPLWQNRNNIKQSKAAMLAADAQLRVTERTLRSNLASLFGDYHASVDNVARWNSVDVEGYKRLSEEAMLNHGTTMMDYLQNLDDMIDVEIQRLATSYQAAILGGQISVYLY